jgi:nucleotide-binding universal stress UspA family protein
MDDLDLKEIAYCTDFSGHANEAFLTAKDLAARYGSNLHIVHVLPTPFVPTSEAYIPIEQDITLVEKATEVAQASIEENYLARLDESQRRFVHFLSGYPATEIVDLATKKKIDLIVMGSHGLTGMAHVFFGSTADRVVRRAPCSVLTVRFRKEED